MNVALKEWSSVAAALERGMQIFLLRKGGIDESKRGFEPKYPEFLLFPTFEHQHAGYLKPEYAGLLSDAAPAGRLRISLLARVIDVSRAPRLPARMQAFRCHVWNEAFIRQRYAYRPDLPLYLLTVRAYRLEHPHVIPLRPSYAGCKSWVHLTEEIPVEAALPVLDDTLFNERRRDLQLWLGSEALEDGKQAAE